MYNINLYSYQKKPYNIEKTYTVHTLDEPGVEKFYSDQSHNFHYLKRTDPFVFKSIVGMDYDTLVKQQKEDIRMLQELKKRGFGVKGPNYTGEQVQFEEQKNPEFETDNVEFGQHLTKYGNHDFNFTEENENYPTATQNHFRSMSSSVGFKPYNKQRDFRATYGYDNKPRFTSNGERYLYAIRSMKNNNFGKNTYVKPKKRYDGFTCDEAPAVKSGRPMTSALKSFNDRMTKSVGIHSPNSTRISLNDDELRQNLYNQTSANWRLPRHLPDIIKIADTRQTIRRQKAGYSKEMGERYDPYALIPPSKNRTGRNYVGDLFKH